MPRPEPIAASILCLAALLGSPAGAATITVNSALDVATDDGLCTLREAIVAANTNDPSGVVVGECAAGEPAMTAIDDIVFAIPGGGVHVIAPDPALPAITEPVHLDATTQGPVDCSSQLLVEITGSALGTEVGPGIYLQSGASGSSVRGFAIHSFDISGNAMGILLNGADDVVVQCNFLGTTADGVAAAGVNRTAGIGLFGHAEGNLIGSDLDGIDDVDEGNLISNNDQAGVTLACSSCTATRIQGNRIGVDAAGSLLGNRFYGVRMFPGFGVTGTTVGGNLLADHSVAGIHLPDGSSNALRGNTFLAEVLMIDLGGDGPTLNDAGDADGGANLQMNHPNPSAAAVDPGDGVLRVEFDLDAAASAVSYPVTVDFLLSSDGLRWHPVGSTTVVSDPGAGLVTVDLSVMGIDLAAGDQVRATATDLVGNTSEVGPAVTSIEADLPAPPAQPTAIFSDGFESGDVGAWVASR